MPHRLWIAASLTVIAIAAFIQVTLSGPPAGIPLQVAPRGAHNYVISPVPGIPLPTGLQSGDELEMQRMPPATRAALILGQRIRPGVRIAVVVRRNTRILTVPVTSRYLPTSVLSRFATATVLRDIMLFNLLALGLLVIWRGRDLAAFGLGLFAIAVITSVCMNSIAVPPAWIVGMQVLSEVVVVPLMFLGLFIMARAVIGDRLRNRATRILTAAYALTYLLVMSLTFVNILGMVYFGSHGLPTLLLAAISCLLALIPLVLLILGYSKANFEQRLRIRWILCSTAAIFLALMLAVTLSTVTSADVQLAVDYSQILFITVAVAGYSYAVLRHRLVDVRVAINRTLVYGIITAIVVGVFAAVSSLTERAALGHNASRMLELIIPLALGIVINTLRRHIDVYIRRFLFRRQYRAEKALNDFSRTCGFAEHPDRLLDLAAEQVFVHSGAQGVACYERDAQSYMRVRQQGKVVFPETVESDDLVFMRLRGGDHEADLQETRSALGVDGYAFPMTVRGRLIGALVCGPRPAEQYTMEERRLLRHVAQQLGTALHALRSRANEQFVDSIARGTVDTASARERARQLAAAWQTG